MHYKIFAFFFSVHPLPALGDVVTFAAPHCDPTVNLYDAFHVVGGDSDDGDEETLVAVWPIHGRGRCQ